MFTWKRLFLSLGFLFLIVIIGWTTWYFTIVRPKLIAEPVMRYNTESQTTMENTSDAASVETSQGQKISQEEDDDDTTDTLVESEGSVNTLPDSVSEVLNQHTHHPDDSNGHNHKDLSAEEMDKERKYLETIDNKINEFRARVNEINKDSEIRNTELANHLNSLSAEEQQAYFENIRSGKVLEEMPPNLFESLRVNGQSKGYSEEAIDEVLELFKQQIQNFASEAGAKRHLEMLRDHGFVPKF
ncbi:hypothetical protein C6501_11115 [Candidatus Poribacteria bacterium]|nr:MAG: hypothetical protein C6501_11115 [Candidatus Poribacteria bacterium]